MEEQKRKRRDCSHQPDTTMEEEKVKPRVHFPQSHTNMEEEKVKPRDHFLQPHTNMEEEKRKVKGHKRSQTEPLSPTKITKLSGHNSDKTDEYESELKSEHDAQSIETFASDNHSQSIPGLDSTKEQEIKEIVFVKKKPSVDEDKEDITVKETTQTSWDVLEDFAPMKASFPKNGLKQWLTLIFERVRVTVRARSSDSGIFEDVDIRDVYNRGIEKCCTEIKRICPNFENDDILIEFGAVAAPFQQILNSFTRPMLVNTVVVLSVKNPKAKKEKNPKKGRRAFYPVFLIRVMTAPYNEEMDVLTDLFECMHQKATVEKLYGLLVTQTDVIFVKYDPNAEVKLGLSASFPANIKDYLEKEITKQLEEALSMIGCLLIKAIKEGRESFNEKM